ncbi:hypothetical protein [Pantoea phytobeneficialis]|uniref:Uncharacterized protein n=1 Tax=Pantoea phytobeneficialis TaxID=2052056 RepID=A0ABT8XPY1_9GAMM|nr:hypothetical protein [Pantoea phytobeneficialis]MDO6405505.1 hypothetical protein [Pantoea phytobeneficialis]
MSRMVRITAANASTFYSSIPGCLRSCSVLKGDVDDKPFGNVEYTLAKSNKYHYLSRSARIECSSKAKNTGKKSKVNFNLSMIARQGDLNLNQ